jgi:hypothetical protein
LKGHFHPKGKAPSKFTIDILKQAKSKLPFSDTRDFEEQKKGLIAPMKEMKIMADGGHVAWDMERFRFLDNGEDFDSIHPSLLRPAGHTLCASESLPASQSSPNRTSGTTPGQARSVPLEGKDRAKIARDFASSSAPFTAQRGVERARQRGPKQTAAPPSSYWASLFRAALPVLLCQNYFSLRCLF